MKRNQLLITLSWLFIIAVQVKGNLRVLRTSPPMNRCLHPVDIVLLLDSSLSMGFQTWINELEFASRFLEHFAIFSHQSHVGIIDFSTYARKHLELIDPRQDLNHIHHVLHCLKDESQYQNGVSLTDCGLGAAFEMFSNAKQNIQRSVPQILVVLTNGQTTWRNGQRGIDLVIPHSQRLISLGIQTYAIAFGNNIDESGLHVIAGAPERVVKYENFDNLMMNVENVAMKVCPVETTEPEEGTIHKPRGEGKIPESEQQGKVPEPDEEGKTTHPEEEAGKISQPDEEGGNITHPDAEEDKMTQPDEEVKITKEEEKGSDCPIRFKKVGCYKDNQIKPRPLETYALNARDPSQSNYIGTMVDWKNYYKFLKEFVCRCAKSAKLSEKEFFGIQFYGECWTGKAKTYDKDGESDKEGCINTSFKPCGSDDQFCSGQKKRNYVYALE